MRGLPQKQNARRADKIKLCGHLRRYKKIVKKTYIIYNKDDIKKQESFSFWHTGRNIPVFCYSTWSRVKKCGRCSRIETERREDEWLIMWRLEDLSGHLEKKNRWHSLNLQRSWICRTKRYPNGSREFPIVKDTTPNMMNPRLYTTSYNKPQGQQFDDTAVLSFIKLQYT